CREGANHAREVGAAPRDPARAPARGAGKAAAVYGRMGAKQCRAANPRGGNPAIVGQRPAEVPGSDDDYRPVLGEPELTRHLVDQVVDVVADAAGAVRAQV